MRLGLLCLPLLGLGACSWVGKGDFDARLLEVDDDGDGVPAAQDCNDSDASISPGQPEIFYDGIDQHCDGGDDYDQDLDGYVATEHVGKVTQGVPGTGALPGGDCDDEEPRVSPQQPDTWYDGLDQNCDGVDDYDQDADGYIPDEYVGLATTYVAGSGSLPGGDCDDLLDSVGPEQADDWYDGIDSDCAGNDDWDQDGDGFIPLELFSEYTATTYADGTGRLPNGDCDDTRADVSPIATDDWYDGLDADCAGDDDYDQDLDGYADASGGGDDCDDLSADVYPGAREILGDLDDSDCDGGNDTFALETISGYTWVGPHSPIFDESSDRIYLSIVASEIDTGSTHYHDSAVALLWFNEDPGDGRDGVAAWSATTTDPADYWVGPGQGFVATDDYLYGVLGLDYGNDRAMRLVRYDVSAGSRLAANANGTDGLLAFDDISISLDDSGAMHVVGCDDSSEVMQYVRVSASWSGGFAANEETSGISAADCAVSVHDGEGHIFTSEQGGIWDYPFDIVGADPVFTGAEFTPDYAPLDLDIPARWSNRVLVMADATSDSVVLLDADGATTIADGDVPLEVDVFEDADGTLYVGYVTPGGHARLAWGTASTGYTEIELVVPFAVSDISVWVSGGYLLYGATGVSDVAVGIAAL